MSPPLTRRRFLRAAGTALAAGLAGCNTVGGPDATPDAATRAGTASPPPTPSPTRTATPTPTPVLTVEREYALGEWHAIQVNEHGPWEFTFASVEFATTFRVDGREGEFSMPPDRQLVVATSRATCVGSDRGLYGWFDMPFAVVTEDGTYVDQPNFEHPSFIGVASHDLQRIEHRAQYRPEGHGAYAGETITSWWLFVVPREVTRQNATLGYDPDGTDAAAYPVRWVLDGR